MKRLTAVMLLLVLVLPAVPGSAGGGHSAYPARAIAYMDIRFRCGCTAVGTGAMICSDGLLTAGHNLICKNHNQTAEHIDFYFGYVSKTDYFYKYNGHIHYWYLDGFNKGYHSRDDIGYVRFDEDVGSRTGWLATRYGPDREFDGASCYISAYSKDGGLTDYSAAISIDSSRQFLVSHDQLPYGGEGAPVYIYRNGKATLVAVYNSHTGYALIGRRLTKDLFNDMKRRLNFGN